MIFLAKGYLKINVYGDNIANPVSEANVTILKKNNIIDETSTNENGETELLSLETVDKEYSLEEQFQTRPYETYDIEASILGLNTTKIYNVPIFDGITSIQNIYLTSIDNEQNTTIEEITPNQLWGDYPSIIDEEKEENIALYCRRAVRKGKHFHRAKPVT